MATPNREHKVSKTVALAQRTAHFSPDRAHRYFLRLDWRPPLDMERPFEIVWIMFNPSITDEKETIDPTVRRCVDFTQQQGGNMCTVVNIHALVTPNPTELVKHSDPTGEHNEEVHRRLAEDCVGMGSRVVAAWGALAAKWPALAERTGLIYQNAGNRLECLGTTKAGWPRHPLYVPKTTPFRHFSVGISASR